MHTILMNLKQALFKKIEIFDLFINLLISPCVHKWWSFWAWSRLVSGHIFMSDQIAAEIPVQKVSARRPQHLI